MFTADQQVKLDTEQQGGQNLNQMWIFPNIKNLFKMLG